MSTLEVLERKKGERSNDREYSHPKFRQLLLLYRGSVRYEEVRACNKSEVSRVAVVEP